MSDEEPVVLDYDEFVHATDNARLFRIEGEERWLPNAVVEEYDTDEKTVTVAYWWAYKHGMI